MAKIILQIQTALFFKNDYTGNFEDISLFLKKPDTTSELMPIPASAPSEIPRLRMIFNDNFRLSFSKNRLDIYFKEMSSIDFEIIEKFINKEEYNIQIGRIGFVKNIFEEENINNLKSLLKIQNIESLPLKEINIRVNNKKTVDTYECNDIESKGSGNLIDDNSGTQKTGTIIIRDINTLPEQITNNEFQFEKIKELISLFNQETDNFLF
ncbi:hypothetical protein M0Q50_07505 [bacterium]|jgi:hypothetical protein|nr:hypothetical protein [bacterium]